MKRFLRIAFGVLAMVFVMLVSAALTLRIAIHGGEVTVPDFSGMTVSEASDAALAKGLGLTIENKFYSTVIPAGRMLSQAPAAGSRVRKHWNVRVTVSLGPQQVSIPDVVGQPQRDAAVALRRSSLDLGTMAHIDAPGDPDMVLAQTPPPNAGVDQPRVSLLLSSQAGDATNSIVLPSFVGMSYTGALHAAGALGIKLTYQDYNPAPSAPDSTAAPGTTGTAAPAGTPATPGLTPGPNGTHLDANGQAVAAVVVPSGPGGPVTGQKPDAGYKASRGAVVKLIFGHQPAPPGQPSGTPANTPATPQ